MDKIYHITVGFIIFASVLLYSNNLFLAYLITGLAGIAKETIDYFSYGKFDWIDLFATLFGGIICHFLTKIIFK